MKIRIENVYSTGFEIIAVLSNGARLVQKTTCRPYALDHLIRDVAEITGQTARGVRQSMRKWIA